MSCNPKVHRKLIEQRKKLDALVVNKIQQWILYLQQKYWMCTPKSLKLLAWKVNTKQNTAQVLAIRGDLGGKQMSTTDILQNFQEYYTSLYRNKINLRSVAFLTSVYPI